MRVIIMSMYGSNTISLCRPFCNNILIFTFSTVSGEQIKGGCTRGDERENVTRN